MKLESISGKPGKHQLGDEQRFASDPAFNGCERIERPCALCRATKIVVIAASGEAWREWRTADGKKLPIGVTPPCIGGEK